MTVKQGTGLKRLETETRLTQSQFEELWPLTHGMRVEKRRYNIPFLNHTLALDVFYGNLAPLILVEVEFDTEEDSRAFLPPDFAERDVTHDQTFKNAQLALNGIPRLRVQAY